MFIKASGCEAIVRESTEIDVEKAEATKPRMIKNDEKAGSSTTLGKADQEIGKATSSTMPGISYEDVVNAVTTCIGRGVTSPKLLRKGDGSCCIFRIPQTLRKIHHKGYEPEIVSIGPYHHKKEHLQMIEEHKHRYLTLFLDEAENAGISSTSLVKKVVDIEKDIRNSYSEELDGVDQTKLVYMMLLDGCFILMLFFFIGTIVDSSKSPNDPILNTPWILSTIRSDLLLLENQVPFILLQTLFEASGKSSLGSGRLNDLAFKFFKLSIQRPEGFWKKHTDVVAKHLLDLIRQTFLPTQSANGSSQNANETSSSSQSDFGLILSAKRLRLQGIKFRASHDSHAFYLRSAHEKSILDIQLKGAEVQIPPMFFDEFLGLLLLNCVAFEQLSMKCQNDITSYVIFMGCLMNEEADVIYLSEKGIVENYFGSGSDISQFFKNMSNGVAFDQSKSYLKEVFEEINKYSSKRWNVEYARFKHLHFDSPWACMSSSAVLAILLLTLFQAIFAGLTYLNPPPTPRSG